MCYDCVSGIDSDETYPGGMPFSRDYRMLLGPEYNLPDYRTESFATKKEEEDLMGDFTINNNDIDFTSNRQLSRQQQMEVGQELFNQFSNQGSSQRTQKPKVKRQSNNDFSEKVLPSGIIKGNNLGIIPGSIVPALRNQMPTFASNIISADRASSACKCSKDFMWEDNRGSNCEFKGMPCNTPGQIGMELL